MTVGLSRTPILGEIKSYGEIGRVGHAKAIWAACVDCGKERWVFLKDGKPISDRCTPCRGKHQRQQWNILPENIKRGYQIGKKPEHKLFYKVACKQCGKERWASYQVGELPELCSKCKYKLTGKRITSKGYVVMHIPNDNPLYPMSARGRILEHRLVVAKALGRCLQPWEIVHHKGTKFPLGSIENKQDNRYPENLDLTLTREHDQITLMQATINKLEARIKTLEARLTILEAEKILEKSQ